jgi:twitching motility protein PilT
MKTIQLNDLLLNCIEQGASDLHLSVGTYPAMRKRGEIEFLADLERMTQESMAELLSGIMQKRYLTELANTKNCAFAYAIPGKGRFRVSVYQQRGTFCLTFRAGNFSAPTREKLRMPEETQALFEIKSGLILISGPKGSGTTSTCSYIIDVLRQTKKYKIVTIENPIENLFSHDNSIVSQMEVGLDVKDMHTGIEIALRDNADVIYLSSMMDTDTIRLALEAARSGTIVIATMDILGVEDVIRNTIDVFPAESTNYIRTLLAQSLKCVISQQLITDINGDLIPLCEVMYGVRAVENLIRENKVVQINQVLQTGSKINMLSKDNHLKKMYKAGQISVDVLKDFATDWKSLSLSMAKDNEE